MQGRTQSSLFFFCNSETYKFVPSPITYVCAKQTIVESEVGLLSIFVGQSLYLFEVRHNPAKDFSGAHVCSASPEHVFG